MAVALFSSRPAIAEAMLSSCVSPPSRDCAIAIVSEYVEATPYAQDSAGFLAQLAAEFGRAGDVTAADDAFARAIKAAVSIESPHDSYAILRAIATLQRSAGRGPAARKTLSIAGNVLLEEPEAVAGHMAASQARRLRDLADEQRGVGDDPGAAETLDVAAEISRSIGEAETRANELALIAAQQALIDGQRQSAITNFAAARATVAGIPDRAARAANLASLARIQAEAGLREAALIDMKEAAAVSEQIAEPLDRGRLQAQIAMTLLTFMTE